MALRIERPSDDKRRSELIDALNRERAMGRVSQKDRDLMIRIYDATPSRNSLVSAGLGGGLAYMLARRRGWVGFRRGLAIGSAALAGTIGGLYVHYYNIYRLLLSMDNRESWVDIKKRYPELQTPNRREAVQSQEQEQEAVVLEPQQVPPTLSLKVKIVDPVWNSFMQDEVAAGRLTQHDSEVAQILSPATMFVYLTLYTPITAMLGGALEFVYAARYRRLRGWRVAGRTILMATLSAPVPSVIWLVKFYTLEAQCDDYPSTMNARKRYDAYYYRLAKKEPPGGSADAERQQLEWEKFRQELLEKEREREREKRK